MNKRGFATYFSWFTKIASIIYAILMQIFTNRPATDIMMISALIAGVGLPIDASKIVQAHGLSHGPYTTTDALGTEIVPDPNAGDDKPEFPDEKPNKTIKEMKRKAGFRK